MLSQIWFGIIAAAVVSAMALSAYCDASLRRLQRKYPGYTGKPQMRQFYVRVITTIER